jgi:hypothetical protein
MLQYILFENARLDVFKYLVSRKVVDVVGGKVQGKTPLQWADEMDATWGDTYRHFKRILPYLYYARDEQRLTELCRVFLLAEKQRATVVPHVLQNTCNLSADLLEELSEYMAPRDVADKPQVQALCTACARVKNIDAGSTQANKLCPHKNANMGAGPPII